MLGSPTIALAAVLLALLAAAGLGSLLAERLSPARLRLILPLIAVVLIAEVPAVPALTRTLAAMIPGQPGNGSLDSLHIALRRKH